jgi:hypothetical protein
MVFVILGLSLLLGLYASGLKRPGGVQGSRSRTDVAIPAMIKT